MLGTRLSGGVERIRLFQVHRYIELNSEQVCMFVSVVPQLKLYIYIYIPSPVPSTELPATHSYFGDVSYGVCHVMKTTMLKVIRLIWCS